MATHFWWLFLALLLVEAVTAPRRERGPEGEPGPPYPLAPRALLGLALLALAGGALRAWVAIGRAERNVDEEQYAALGAFVRRAHESVFTSQWVVRPHMGLFGLADPPYPLVDAITSLVLAAGAWLLGLMLLRARGRLLPAALVVPLTLWGCVPFEGLTSNAEPYALLGLCAWAAVRLPVWRAPETTWRALGAGVCLGAAFVGKEQALPFVLAEALLALPRARAAPRPLRAFAVSQGLAAAGFLAPVGLLLLAFAWHGQLGDHLRVTLLWGTAAGSPGSFADGERHSGGVGWFLACAPLALALLPSSPVTLLGLLRGLVPWPRGGQEARLRAGLLVFALVGVAITCIGMRWLRHYFLLVVPALAPLAALRLSEAWDDLRARRRGLANVCLALGLGLAALYEHSKLVQFPHVSGLSGGLKPPERAALAAIASHLRATVPADQPIFVHGWRPELYAAAGRAPSSRFVGGCVPPDEGVIADLERWPPAAVVVAGPAGLRLGPGDLYDLSLHPALREWLLARGYRHARAIGPYLVLSPSPPG